MDEFNPCQECLGKNENECCIDTFVILNPTEIQLFEKFKGFKHVENGGIFYTTQNCPYLNKQKNCTIHENKPLYCKYYPIFITGKIYVDKQCPVHKSECYKLTSKKLQSLVELQTQFPIYKKDWFFSDVQKKYNI